MNKMLGNEEADVLLKLRKHFPTAVVAGGAARDTILGLPYNNVDILIPQGNPLVKRYGYGYLVDEFLPEQVFGEEDQTYKIRPFSSAEFAGHNAMPNEYLNKVPFVLVNTVYKKAKYQLIFGDIKISKFTFNCDHVVWNGNAFKESQAFTEFKQKKILRQLGNKGKFFPNLIEKLVSKIPGITLDEDLKAAMDSYYKKIEASHIAAKKQDKKYAKIAVNFDAAQHQMEMANQWAVMNAAQQMAQPAGMENIQWEPAPMGPVNNWLEEDAIAEDMWFKKPAGG